MATQQALVILDKGVLRLFEEFPIPPLRPGTVRVRVHAVALNPSDQAHINDWPSIGCLSGCDFSGVIEAVFDPKKSDGLVVGDRVCGCTHGANVMRPTDGAFAEHIVVPEFLCIRVPKDMDIAAAASLSVGAITSGLALYDCLSLPLPTNGPTEHGQKILIYGGSTATGSLMIQYAKLSGFEVITTCSPRNFDMVKSRGADHVFDYNSDAAVAEIRELTQNKLHLVVNCARGDESHTFCEACIGDAGGKLCGLLKRPGGDRKDIQHSLVWAYHAMGEEIYEFDVHDPAMPELAKFTAAFVSWTDKLLEQGKLQFHPVDIRTEGLKAVPKGLQELRAGSVSGKKIVCKLVE